MGLNDFAKNTKVSMDSSRQELERLLRRAGATKAMTGWDEEKAYVAFVINGLPIKQQVTMPKQDEFAQTDTGLERKKDVQLKVWEQACRQRMREFVHLLKAKLIAVAIGVRGLEQEFFGDICLPDGQTVFELQKEELNQAMTSGKMPALLPGL